MGGQHLIGCRLNRLAARKRYLEFSSGRNLKHNQVAGRQVFRLSASDSGYELGNSLVFHAVAPFCFNCFVAFIPSAPLSTRASGSLNNSTGAGSASRSLFPLVKRMQVGGIWINRVRELNAGPLPELGAKLFMQHGMCSPPSITRLAGVGAASIRPPPVSCVSKSISSAATSMARNASSAAAVITRRWPRSFRCSFTGQRSPPHSAAAVPRRPVAAQNVEPESIRACAL